MGKVRNGERESAQWRGNIERSSQNQLPNVLPPAEFDDWITGREGAETVLLWRRCHTRVYLLGREAAKSAMQEKVTLPVSSLLYCFHVESNCFHVEIGKRKKRQEELLFFGLPLSRPRALAGTLVWLRGPCDRWVSQ
jgi:hypothetical protein